MDGKRDAGRAGETRRPAGEQLGSDTGQAAPRVLILVVERDPYIQALERALLEDRGYRPEFAADGKVALEMVRSLRPRLLISEILVPGLDGLEVCRCIRRDPETCHIRVLIFSELLAERRAREAGADAFLPKPVDQRVLLDKVGELLGSAEEGS